MARTKAEKRLEALTKSWRRLPQPKCPEGREDELSFRVHVGRKFCTIEFIWEEDPQVEAYEVMWICVEVSRTKLLWECSVESSFRESKDFWVGEAIYKLARRFHQLYIIHKGAPLPL